MYSKILKKIRAELNVNAEKVYRYGSKKFFNEEINPIGVRTPIVRKIAKKYYKEIKHLSKKELLDLCEKLMDKNTMEETTIALQWSREAYNELEVSDFTRFEKWIKYTSPQKLDSMIRYIRDCDNQSVSYAIVLWGRKDGTIRVRSKSR